MGLLSSQDGDRGPPLRSSVKGHSRQNTTVNTSLATNERRQREALRCLIHYPLNIKISTKNSSPQVGCNFTGSIKFFKKKKRKVNLIGGSKISSWATVWCVSQHTVAHGSFLGLFHFLDLQGYNQGSSPVGTRGIGVPVLSHSGNSVPVHTWKQQIWNI